MLFYDLALNCWVRNPGSTSPPPIVPVLTVGSVAQMMVKFCKGEEIVTSFTAFSAGIKISGDFTGEYIAQDDAPSELGGDSYVFQFDLTTPESRAYFTENPTAEIFTAAIMIGYTESEIDGATGPLEIAIQNSYLQ